MTAVGESPQAVVEAQRAGVPALLGRYACVVERELDRALDALSSPASTMVRYHLGRADRDGTPGHWYRGKALRPSLCLFTAEAVEGRAGAALPAAASLEAVHNFSLVHDDVEDEDLERHHRSTVWAVWGKGQAVVAGNLLRVLADLCPALLAREGASPRHIARVSRVLSDRTLEMIRGQVLDVSFEGRTDVSVEEYRHMIALKTGALFGAAMETGALLGGADGGTVALLAECGRELGLAFQLRDDHLGAWGDAQQLGKPVGSDVRRRKKSFPAVYALQSAAKEDRKSLHSLYRSPAVLGEEEIRHALRIMERAGAREAGQRLEEEHRLRALELAARAPLAAWARPALEEIAGFLSQRAS